MKTQYKPSLIYKTIPLLAFFCFSLNIKAQITIECPTGDRQICWSDSTTGSIVYKGGGPRTVIIKE